MAFTLRVAGLLAVVALSACKEEAEPTTSNTRPVRTITVRHTPDAGSVSLTGQIRPRDQVNLAFRIDGRMVERTVSVGDQLALGQKVARLDEDAAQNNLRRARADVSTAGATLAQAHADEARQKALLKKGIIASARYEQAERALKSAEAEVEAAEAQLKSAGDNLAYTVLKADSEGIVTAVGAEPGEVVRVGQMIVQLMRGGGKDAVFNVPAQLIRGTSRDIVVTVALADDPSITATGKVREVAPQADPTTGTYLVKFGLTDPPTSMRLGSTVVGRALLTSQLVVRLPGTALTDVNGNGSVWVVNPEQMTVSSRSVRVLRYEGDAAVVGGGLIDGEIVVTSGVHALRPGQEVKLLDPRS
jgi:RND family efflux transporter MFP subunit